MTRLPHTAAPQQQIELTGRRCELLQAPLSAGNARAEEQQPLLRQAKSDSAGGAEQPAHTVVDMPPLQEHVAGSEASTDTPLIASPVLALPTVANAIMMQLKLPDVRSMARTCSAWHRVAQGPVPWLAASRGADEVVLLRANERRALGSQNTSGERLQARARLMGKLIGGVLYGLAGSASLSRGQNVLGAAEIVFAPLMALGWGDLFAVSAKPVARWLDRKEENQSIAADRRVEQAEFGYRCAIQVMTADAVNPGVRRAALGAMKRGLLRDDADSTTMLEELADAVRQGDIGRIERLIDQCIARLRIDLKSDTALRRGLLILLLRNERLDLLAKLQHAGVALDSSNHGEVTVKAMLAARLRRHTEDANLPEVEAYLQLLPDCIEEPLPWTCTGMQEALKRPGNEEFVERHQTYFDSRLEAACANADLHTMAVLVDMGCQLTGSASQFVDKMMWEAFEQKNWPRLAQLRTLCGRTLESMLLKLDEEVFTAISQGDAAAVHSLRQAGAVCLLSHYAHGSHHDFAERLGRPDVLAALSS